MNRAFMRSAVALCALQATGAAGSIIEYVPSKDNTLIQQTNPANQLSNGQGDLFVGRTNQDGQGTATISIRRGLVHFAVDASIPTGAAITGVTLTMRDVMGLNGDRNVELHRLLQDWGEGNSLFNGGQGAPAQNGDATWLYTFFNAANPASSPAWSTPGGDFNSTVSGSALVSDDLGGGQTFTWSSNDFPQMIVDVQSWLDDPTNNFGWIILGDESAGQTAKRLNSGESAFPPLLQITYAVPERSTFAYSSIAVFCGIVGCWMQRRRKPTRA